MDRPLSGIDVRALAHFVAKDPSRVTHGVMLYPPTETQRGAAVATNGKMLAAVAIDWTPACELERDSAANVIPAALWKQLAPRAADRARDFRLETQQPGETYTPTVEVSHPGKEGSTMPVSARSSESLSGMRFPDAARAWPTEPITAAFSMDPELLGAVVKAAKEYGAEYLHVAIRDERTAIEFRAPGGFSAVVMPRVPDHGTVASMMECSPEWLETPKKETAAAEETR